MNHTFSIHCGAYIWLFWRQISEASFLTTPRLHRESRSSATIHDWCTVWASETPILKAYSRMGPPVQTVMGTEGGSLEYLEGWLPIITFQLECDVTHNTLNWSQLRQPLHVAVSLVKLDTNLGKILGRHYLPWGTSRSWRTKLGGYVCAKIAPRTRKWRTSSSVDNSGGKDDDHHDVPTILKA